MTEAPSETELQASRLIHKYGRSGATKAASKNAKAAASDAQEEFWERVIDLIEDACDQEPALPASQP